MKEKEINILNQKDSIEKINDIEIFGNTDSFKLMCKASSKEQGWMKSTKICNVPNGCIMQVSTQQKNQDGSYSLSEAVTFIPQCKINEENIIELIK